MMDRPTFDVSACKGKTVKLYFKGVEDSEEQISFVIDDGTPVGYELVAVIIIVPCGAAALADIPLCAPAEKFQRVEIFAATETVRA
jgi:hypothetical protein